MSYIIYIYNYVVVVFSILIRASFSPTPNTNTTITIIDFEKKINHPLCNLQLQFLKKKQLQLATPIILPHED
jgi:hypothetical protein